MANFKDKEMKIAAQMDHIATVNPKTDTSFALLLKAQERGHMIFHYTPDRLCFEDGVLYATVEPLELCSVSAYGKKQEHYKLGAPKRIDLSTMDVVLLRQDPPFDMNYLTTTYLLERLPKETLVINDPRWVRNSPEKIFVTQFLEFMPPTLITRHKPDIVAFREKHGTIIIKPLYGNGGANVFLIKPEDKNFNALIELFQQLTSEAFIVQGYIDAVEKGDKRIILLDGEPVGAINRIPLQEETRSNMHAGGRVEKVELTARDLEICKAIGPKLKDYGLFFVGIDIIGDYITEINVTSPTGIQEILTLSNIDIATLFWQKIENFRNGK